MRPIVVSLVLASLLGAQDASAQEGRDERVQVLLKNGYSLIGVAKKGVRCERLVRGNFKPCSDANERSAGIRVWYYQDLDGYIFLDSHSLDHVDVLGTLTAEESRALADAVAAARGGRSQRETTSRPVDRKAGDGPSSRPSDQSGLTAAEKAILDRFPPEKGWSPEKFGELQRKRIVLHVNPSGEEQAFIDAFPAFQDAWKKWLAAQPKGDGETKAVEGSDPSQPKPPGRKKV